MRSQTRISRLFLLFFVLSGCLDAVPSGEIGIARYVGNVRVDDEIYLIPPIADRQGNVYVAYGQREMLFSNIYIGMHDGGWKTGCKGHRGDSHGLHGWVGKSVDRVWYWSGDALVVASPKNYGCRYLTRDPVSNTRLAFSAVFPFVRDMPSRAYTAGLLRFEGSERIPLVEVDLDRNVYRKPTDVFPQRARSIEVIGVGANKTGSNLVFVARYRERSETITQAFFVDEKRRVEKVNVASAFSGVREYGIEGYLELLGPQTAVGMTDTKKIIFLSLEGAKDVSLPKKFEPYGIHRWKGNVFAVGMMDKMPYIIKVLPDGSLGEGSIWFSAANMQERLDASDVIVYDDRNTPFRYVEWQDTSTAIGKYPFLSPFSLDEYGPDMTSWLISGHSYEASGETMEAVSVSPAGVSYP